MSNHPQNPPRPPGNPAQLQARKEEMERARAEFEQAERERALAFAEVFGHDDKSRTERQRIVWANLSRVCCMEATTALSTTPQEQGPIDGNRTHVLEGRRQVMVHISLNVKRASEPPPGV